MTKNDPEARLAAIEERLAKLEAAAKARARADAEFSALLKAFLQVPAAETWLSEGGSWPANS